MIDDPLIKAKLHFFVSVAKQMEPFLAKYQTDAPMIPFLAADLGVLLKNLMIRFVKHDVIDSCKSVFSLTKVQYHAPSNQRDSSKFDVGFSAKMALRNTDITDQMRQTFCIECRDMLVAMISKVIEKSPIQSSLVRSLTWLDPHLLPKISESHLSRRVENLDVTLRHMVESGRISSAICDVVRKEYRAACEEIAASETVSSFADFDTSVHRLDKLLFPMLGNDKKYSSLWTVVQQILILSHGQATVERGFSINKETSTDNLTKESLQARRLISDALIHVGGIQNFAITKELIKYTSSARRKYQDHLERKKSIEKGEELRKKRERDNEREVELNAKRLRLTEDISNLQAAADAKAMEAEKKQNMQLLIQSNALRRRADEIKEEIKKLYVK